MARALPRELSGLMVVTPPSGLVISLNDAKRHLRFTSQEEDPVIRRLIKAATTWIEDFTHRQLLPATFRQEFECFPSSSSDPIKILRPPLQSVTSVQYYDEDGTLQTWDPAEYQVDVVSEPGRLMPLPNYSWPSTQSGRFGAVQVTFVAGYATKDLIPENIISAMLMLIGSLFARREDDVVTSLVLEVPNGVKRLAWPERVVLFP